MNWINAFELLCYALTAILLVDIIKARDWKELQVFLSGALAGFTLELGAVRLTDIYHYSDLYYLSIGIPPYQFPFFGGLMWGGVAVCALRIAEKFNGSHLTTALISGWLVVSMDLLLDVAAIRLSGGFWVWDGRPINLDINHHMWMSIIWVNFLGYLFETPALIYLTLRHEDRLKKKALGAHEGGEDGRPRRQSILMMALRVVLIGWGAVIFVALASGIALYLDGISDEWTSFLAFVALWLAILGKILVTLKSQAHKFSWRVKKDRVLILFWMALYGYCFLALTSLGIFAARPLYGLFALCLWAFTIALSLIQVKGE